MLSAQIHCVVGIDVAKASHVICALSAPSGCAIHGERRPLTLSASALSSLSLAKLTPMEFFRSEP